MRVAVALVAFAVMALASVVIVSARIDIRRHHRVAREQHRLSAAEEGELDSAIDVDSDIDSNAGTAADAETEVGVTPGRLMCACLLPPARSGVMPTCAQCATEPDTANARGANTVGLELACERVVRPAMAWRRAYLGSLATPRVANAENMCNTKGARPVYSLWRLPDVWKPDVPRMGFEYEFTRASLPNCRQQQFVASPLLAPVPVEMLHGAPAIPLSKLTCDEQIFELITGPLPTNKDALWVVRRSAELFYDTLLEMPAQVSPVANNPVRDIVRRFDAKVLAEVGTADPLDTRGFRKIRMMLLGNGAAAPVLARDNAVTILADRNGINVQTTAEVPLSAYASLQASGVARGTNLDQFINEQPRKLLKVWRTAAQSIVANDAAFANPNLRANGGDCAVRGVLTLLLATVTSAVSAEGRNRNANHQKNWFGALPRAPIHQLTKLLTPDQRDALSLYYNSGRCQHAPAPPMGAGAGAAAAQPDTSLAGHLIAAFRHPAAGDFYTAPAAAGAGAAAPANVNGIDFDALLYRNNPGTPTHAATWNDWVVAIRIAAPAFCRFLRVGRDGLLPIPPVAPGVGGLVQTDHGPRGRDDPGRLVAARVVGGRVHMAVEFRESNTRLNHHLHPLLQPQNTFNALGARKPDEWLAVLQSVQASTTC